MGLVKYNNLSISSIDDVSNTDGAMILIKTLTASSSGTLSFVNGSDDVVLDNTYPIYLFKFIGIHPSTEATFNFNFRDGGSSYDATKTTTHFYAYHNEADSSNGLQYTTGYDIAQGTGFQVIGDNLDADNDHNLTGTLHLFNPSSTTFVKHFLGTVQFNSENGQSTNTFVAGYCNVTAAIDGAQFKFSSGNIDS